MVVVQVRDQHGVGRPAAPRWGKGGRRRRKPSNPSRSNGSVRTLVPAASIATVECPTKVTRVSAGLGPAASDLGAVLICSVRGRTSHHPGGRRGYCAPMQAAPRDPPPATHRLGVGEAEAPRGMSSPHYGEEVTWQPTRPRLRADRIVVSWVVTAIAVYVAAALVPGVDLDGFGGAFVVAAAIAFLNAVLPPFVAGLRLPFALISGFLAVLVVDAGALLLAHELLEAEIRVDSPGSALAAALVISAVSIVLQVLTGTNDDDEYALRVVQRVARRQGARAPHRRGGDHLPRDRRARTAGASQRDARRKRPDDGPMGRRARLPPHRVGARPLIADGRQPGRASCSGRTRTSPPFGGWRRRPAG